MQKINKFLAVLAATLAATFLFAACNDKPDDGGKTEEPVKYTVTYSAGEGSGTAPAGGSYKAGATFALPDPTGLSKDGCTFDKWNDGATDYAVGETYTMPAKNVTFTATWKDDEETPPTPSTDPILTETANAVILHDAEKTTGSINLFADGTGYIVVTNKSSGLAVLDFVNITYSVNNGMFTILTAPDSKLTVPVSGTIAGNKVSITLTNRSATGVETQFLFESDLYELNIDYAYGSNVSKGAYPVGMPFDLTDVADRDGYVLGGFKINGEDKTVDFGRTFTMPSKTTSVKYIWNEVQVVNYTVTYKAGDGVGADYADTATSASYTLLYNTKTGFTRDGYKFAGWSVNGTPYGTGAKITLTGDTDVIARWNKVYTVAYANVNFTDINTNFDATDTYYTEFTAEMYFLPYETKPMFSGDVVYFNRIGAALQGWTSSADEGTDKAGTVYTPGSKYVLTQNTTFTAVWSNGDDFAAYEGRYVDNEGIVIEGTYDIKEISLDGRVLTVVDDGVSRDIELSMSGSNTATGTLGGYNVTAVFATNKITLTFTQLTKTYSAEFTKFVATDKTLADYVGYWKGELSFNSYDYVLINVSSDKIALSEGYTSIADDFTEYAVTEDKTGVNLIVKYEKTVFGTTTTITVEFTEDNKFTITTVKTSRFGSPTITTAEFTKTQMYEVSYSLGAGYVGDSTVPQGYSIAAGGKIVAPAADPKWSAHRFLGWYVGDATATYDFDTVVTGNIALTAKWEELTEVTVTFNTGDTSLTVPAQIVAVNGKATEPAALTRDGYRFDGWFIGSITGAQFNFDTALTDDITLVAKWSRQYTVTYVKPDGAVGDVPTAETVYAGDNYTLIDCPFTKDGYMFMGWKLGASSSLSSANTVRKVMNDMTFTAVFGKTYTNSQDSDHAIVLRDDGYAVDSGEIYSYTVDGNIVTIELDDFGSVYYIELEGSTFIALDALRDFEFTAKNGTAKLTFDGKGGAKIGTYSAAYTPIYNEGYIVGFNLTVDSKTYEVLIELDMDAGAYVINVAITADGVEYVFGNPPVVYTVTYEIDDSVTGTAPAATTVTATDGTATVTLASGEGLTKDGYTFAGWTVKGGDGTVYKTTYSATGNVTFVAAWTENGQTPAGGNKLKDFAGDSATTCVTYGYSSADIAGNNTVDFSTVKLYKIDFYWQGTGYSKGYTIKRYWGTKSSTGVIKDESYVNSVDQDADNATVSLKVSGFTIKMTFAINEAGARTVKFQIETGNQTNVFTDGPTWTEITA